MIVLAKGNTETICITPKENSSLNLVNYKIVFTNRTTKEVVDFWFADISTTARCQKFTIIVNTYFQNYDEGFWEYAVYGTATLNGTPNTPMLENGLMYLKPQTNYEPTKYNEQDTAFTTYSGQ